MSQMCCLKSEQICLVYLSIFFPYITGFVLNLPFSSLSLIHVLSILKKYVVTLLNSMLISSPSVIWIVDPNMTQTERFLIQV